MAFIALKEAWAPAVIATLVYAIISAIPQFFWSFFAGGDPTTVSTWVFIVAVALVIALEIPAMYAYTVSMLDFLRGDTEGTANRMIGYIKNDYKRCLKTALLANVYTFLWSMLFIIPGIIKGYSYAMTFFIAKDNPNLSAEEAIQASMKLMDGNKMKLFLLDLSFIGWIILSIITFGLGFLFVTPYMNNARAAFYEDIAGDVKISVADKTDNITMEA